MAEQPTKPTQKAAPRTFQVGDIVKVKPGGIVTRPDGSTHIVIKGAFYLDQPGTFLVDGEKVSVR